MSTPKPIRPTGSLNSTRQMLDELDALMERMLALPVTDLEENPSTAIDVRDRQHLAASLTVLEPPPPPAIAPPPQVEVNPSDRPTIRVDPSSTPAVRGPKKQPKPEVSTGAAVDPSSAQEVVEEDLLPPLVVRKPSPSGSLPPARRPLRMLLLQPLLWINRVYDNATHWLGPVGQWLRSGRGRTVLGLAGLTLLGLATVWCLRDWLGWNR